MRASRRSVLALGLAGSAGTLAGCEERAAAAPDRVAFYGRHQAGIATPAPARLAFAAYDLTLDGAAADNRAALRRLLRTWTAAAAAMTDGRTVPGDNDNLAAPPADTGEAYGASPANLTVTFGVGPSLFDHRFGLADRRPAALAALPPLAPENLDPSRSNGDLAIQACSDDPVVAFHAIRNLARLARGTAVMRWSQLGFGKAVGNAASLRSDTPGNAASLRSGGADQETPRNLMGFKDGTRNLDTRDSALLDQHVWVGAATDQAWMRGGSYLVVRRIQMRIESWDRDYLDDQQHVIGRFKYSGAPLSGGAEHDTPDFAAKGADGGAVIPADSHVALAAHENNNGLRILRRGYSFTDGIISARGELDAGLFFMAYQQDPRRQFVPLQRKLGRSDALNEYIQHVGSGLYACPPGVSGASDYWASALLS
ncbi:MAG TPA: iron uptake transporter deferrochelatase/peroxidase subunit [Rugosimonospora sp.]|nr:iron uptake transporter deferrochelatase/peroxidase subunit [Rugosimonospora sp.]